MFLDINPIKELYKAQPFKYSEFFKMFLGIYIIAVICALFIFSGSIFADTASRILSEQLAPTGIEFFCSVGVLYFTFKIVISGPITEYDAPATKAFICGSKLGIGLLFTYVSIMRAG